MKQQSVTVTVEKIIYGGQGLATLEDGKKVLLWGGLPGETVQARITKAKRTWAEGVVEAVVSASPHRVTARDPESYLSTSPWQTLEYTEENTLKKQLIVEQSQQHGISLTPDDFTAPEDPYEYRNKIEFSFWWSNESNQLDLAFFKRGSHYKQPVEGTSLAHPEINAAALKIRDYLRAQKVEARALKTLLIRCNQRGEIIAQLYTKNPDFLLKADNKLFDITGFGMYYSHPKSPASVITTVLHESGSTQLTDTIQEKSYTYAANGFFQINLPMYEAALHTMARFIDHKTPLLDFYSGVGSIGLSIAQKTQQLTLIEADERCIAEAHANAREIKQDTHIIHATSETALEYITGKEQVIVDPPRAGLHQKVIDRLLEVTPETILYLSCNPATQARDIALLSEHYTVGYAHGFNFFPRTPHIENFVILNRL